jgi:hypothetical protein
MINLHSEYFMTRILVTPHPQRIPNVRESL